MNRLYTYKLTHTSKDTAASSAVSSPGLCKLNLIPQISSFSFHRLKLNLSLPVFFVQTYNRAVTSLSLRFSLYLNSLNLTNQRVLFFLHLLDIFAKEGLLAFCELLDLVYGLSVHLLFNLSCKGVLVDAIFDEAELVLV